MNSDFSDFAALYANLSDEYLVELAASSDTLTEAARKALQMELSQRKLDSPPLQLPAIAQPALRGLVTLRRYRDLSEAVVARSALASAGIEAFLRDENLVRLEWQMSQSLGGIRLQVGLEDLDGAFEVLDQAAPEAIPFGGEADFPQPRCPACNSTAVSFRGPYRGAALASLYLFSLPLPLGSDTWSCDICHTRWQDTEET